MNGQFDRAAAKAAGYTDAQIDAYLASKAKKAPTEAPIQRAPQAPARPERRAMPEMPAIAADVTRAPRGMGRAEQEAEAAARAERQTRGAGQIRAAVQGATFGFGEEAEALVRSLLPGGRPYAQGVEAARQNLREYRQLAPGEAMALETIGGLAVPGVGGVKAMQAASRAKEVTKAATGVGRVAQLVTGAGRAATATPARQAVVQGGLAGAGSAEGDLSSRLTGVGMGGLLGGTLGTAFGATATAGAEVAQRGLRFAKAGTRAIQQALQKANMTPEELASRMAAAGPDETVADIIGEPAVRALREIRTKGERGGRIVGEAMEERLQTSPERLITGVYGPSRQPENIVQAVNESIKRGAEISGPLYRAFEQEAPKAIPEIDKIIGRPLMQQAMDRARRNAANEGRQFIEPAIPEQAGQLLDAMGRPVMQKAKPATYDPQSLDDMKKAMDALIYDGRPGNVQPGQGGLAPSEVQNMKELRRQFINAVDAAYPETYAAARAAWAGEYAVREALEEGQSIAGKLISPEKIADDMAQYDDVTRDAFRRGYLDGLRQRIEDRKIGPSYVSGEGFAKRIKAVLGDEEGERVVQAFRTEKDLVTTARTVLGGSQAIRPDAGVLEVGGTEIATLASPGGMRRGMLAGVREGLRGLAEPMMSARRTEEAQKLLTRRTGIGDILDALAREEQVQRRARNIGTLSGGALARGAGASFGRQQY
jgi:hypothetical protein